MAAHATSRICSLGAAAARTPLHRALLPTKGANYSTTSRTLQRAVPCTRASPVFHKAAHLPSVASRLSITRAASTSADTTTPSNSTSTVTTAAPAQPTQTQSQTPSPTTLTWNEFLKLRRTRRYVNLAASMVSGVGSVAAATPVFVEYEVDTLGAQMTGLDPMFVVGGSLAAVGVVGWLMGPFLGTAFFKVWKSSVATEFAMVCLLCERVFLIGTVFGG